MFSERILSQKCHIFYDSIYMKRPEKERAWRQKAGSWFPRARKNRLSRGKITFDDRRTLGTEWESGSTYWPTGDLEAHWNLQHVYHHHNQKGRKTGSYLVIYPLDNFNVKKKPKTLDTCYWKCDQQHWHHSEAC